MEIEQSEHIIRDHNISDRNLRYIASQKIVGYDN